MPSRHIIGAIAAAVLAIPARGQQAQPPAQASGLTDAQKLQKSDENIDRMRVLVKQVTSRLEDARNEKDVVKLNCVNEKLTQMKAFLKVSEQADVSLQELVGRNARNRAASEAADAEFHKIGVAKAKVEQLRTDADECVAKLAFVVDNRTTVEVETPRGLPSGDVTRREPPPPPVVRPPAASPDY